MGAPDPYTEQNNHLSTPHQYPTIWRMLLWVIGDFIAAVLIVPVTLLVAFILTGFEPLFDFITLSAVLYAVIWVVFIQFTRKAAQRQSVAQRKARAIVRGVALVCAVLVYGYLFFPFFAMSKFKPQQMSCQSNQKQLSLGLLMYAEDWDETLPPADRWAQVIYPYTKSSHILHCPQDAEKGHVSYGMNRFLSGKKLEDIKNPSDVVLLFDTTKPGASPSGGRAAVAYPPRHNDGNFYAFLDGHVKHYKEVPAFTPTQAQP